MVVRVISPDCFLFGDSFCARTSLLWCFPRNTSSVFYELTHLSAMSSCGWKLDIYYFNRKMLQTFKASNVVCRGFLLSYEITVGQGWESPYEVVLITVLIIKSWHVTSVQAHNLDDPHQNWSQTRISSSQNQDQMDVEILHIAIT